MLILDWEVDLLSARAIICRCYKQHTYIVCDICIITKCTNVKHQGVKKKVILVSLKDDALEYPTEFSEELTALFLYFLRHYML